MKDLFFTLFHFFRGFYGQAIFLFTISVERKLLYLYFLLLLLLKRSPFHLGTTVNFVAVRQFIVCLSDCMNVCLGYKSSKNWLILTKFGYVFVVSKLGLYTENCDRMLDTFDRDASKSWIFVFIYAIPLTINLCDNDISRTWITGF